MKKSKISFYFVFITLFTLVSIFSTLVQSSYNNLINPVKEVEKNELLRSIDPTLDTEIIKEIENHPEYIDIGEINFVQDIPSNLDDNGGN